MPELTVQGKKAFYRQSGNGDKSVLLIHGAGGNSLHWMFCQPPAGWRLLALDLPGHGQSGGHPRDSVWDYAAWVADFIASLGEQPLLAGHSMGGAISLAMVLSRPELASGLVLVGTGAKLGVTPAILELCAAGDAVAVEKMLAEWAFGPFTALVQVQEWYRLFGQAPCGAYLADFTACNRFDVRDRLAEITLPVLVVCGDKDRLTPVKYSQYLASHIRGARLVEIPGAGHMVMLEQPAAFNRTLAEFCLELAGPGP